MKMVYGTGRPSILALPFLSKDWLDDAKIIVRRLSETAGYHRRYA